MKVEIILTNHTRLKINYLCFAFGLMCLVGSYACSFLEIDCFLVTQVPKRSKYWSSSLSTLYSTHLQQTFSSLKTSFICFDLVGKQASCCLIKRINYYSNVPNKRTCLKMTSNSLVLASKDSKLNFLKQKMRNFMLHWKSCMYVYLMIYSLISISKGNLIYLLKVARIINQNECHKPFFDLFSKKQFH